MDLAVVQGLAQAAGIDGENFLIICGKMLLGYAEAACRSQAAYLSYADPGLAMRISWVQNLLSCLLSSLLSLCYQVQ